MLSMKTDIGILNGYVYEDSSWKPNCEMMKTMWIIDSSTWSSERALSIACNENQTLKTINKDKLLCITTENVQPKKTCGILSAAADEWKAHTRKAYGQQKGSLRQKCSHSLSASSQWHQIANRQRADISYIHYGYCHYWAICTVHQPPSIRLYVIGVTVVVKE